MKKSLIIFSCLVFMFLLGNITTYAQFGNIKKAVKKEVKKANPLTEEEKKADDQTTQQETNEEVKEQPEIKPEGKIIYVSNSGSNRNPGTKEAPIKNLDKAIQVANEYDKIYVQEGTYSGTFDVGYFEITKPLELYGGYNSDFTQRDPMNTPSVIQTIKDKATSSKQSIIMISETHDVVIDGFVIDMGKHNNYDNKAPEGVETGYLTLTNTGGTPKRSAIKIVGNNVKIQNNTFANISYGGVFIMQRMNMEGKILIDNNVFVNVAQAGIECNPLRGPGEIRDIEISNNTFAFMYGTTFLNDNLGCAVWLKGKANYNVHHNIFSYASDAALRYLDYSESTLKLDYNLFMNNRKNDIHTSIYNKRVFITVEEFEDVDFVSSLQGNKRMTKKLPLNEAYTSEFITMAAEVSMEYDPSTDWNQVRSILGLPQQASGTATISFFANRYPWQESVKLFGAVSEFGAQKP
ncbi:MAG: right-handed parallel beta-helix repeat-containing protein [Bacteroidetes bacterium]|nr:right-handed parallel beta-helix repeat-containing protein [Bacteroidota bacterium]